GGAPKPSANGVCKNSSGISASASGANRAAKHGTSRANDVLAIATLPKYVSSSPRRPYQALGGSDCSKEAVEYCRAWLPPPGSALVCLSIEKINRHRRLLCNKPIFPAPDFPRSAASARARG